MKVIAAKGTRCPKEENPREYITDDTPTDVPETAYYKRLVRDGSLIEVVESGLTENETKKGGKR